MSFPIYLPDHITFSIDPYVDDEGKYCDDDFRLVARRLKEGKRVKCRVVTPIYVSDDLNTSNVSGSLISDNVWWFGCEARVEHSRKTGEETWVKVAGWIGDSPGRIGTEDFYISPEDVDEGFGDYLEDACKEDNEETSIVITTRITQSASPIEMPYD